VTNQVTVEVFLPDPDTEDEYVPCVLLMDEGAYLEAVEKGREACMGPQDGDHVH